MKELFTCAGCGGCAVRPGFGSTSPDTYVCTQRGGEVEPDDGCTLGCAGVPVQAVEACGVDVPGRVGYGCEVPDA